MKAGFDQNSTMKWFLTVVASSEKMGDKFNRLIEAEGWDCDNVDLRVSLNGIEFAELDDLFTRLHNEMQSREDEIADLRYKLKRFNEVKEMMREEIEKEIMEGK